LQLQRPFLQQHPQCSPPLSFAARSSSLCGGAKKENGEAAENGDGEDNGSVDMAKNEEMAGLTASKIKSKYEPNNVVEDVIMGPGQEKRKRPPFVSVQFEEFGKLGTKNGSGHRRTSTTRHKVHSMSALGTKAYALRIKSRFAENIYCFVLATALVAAAPLMPSFYLRCA
jgi:hypothetical protein